MKLISVLVFVTLATQSVSAKSFKCFPKSAIDAASQALSDLVTEFQSTSDSIGSDQNATQEIKYALSKIGDEIDAFSSYFNSHQGQVDPSAAISRAINITQELIALTKNETANVEQRALDTEIDNSLDELKNELLNAVNSVANLGPTPQQGLDLIAEAQSNYDDLANYLTENAGNRNDTVAVEKIEACRQKIIDFVTFEINYLTNSTTPASSENSN